MSRYTESEAAFYRSEGMVTTDYEPKVTATTPPKPDMRFSEHVKGWPPGFHMEYGKILPPGAHHNRDDSSLIRYGDGKVAFASCEWVRQHYLREALAAVQ